MNLELHNVKELNKLDLKTTFEHAKRQSWPQYIYNSIHLQGIITPRNSTDRHKVVFNW